MRTTRSQQLLRARQCKFAAASVILLVCIVLVHWIIQRWDYPQPQLPSRATNASVRPLILQSKAPTTAAPTTTAPTT